MSDILRKMVSVSDADQKYMQKEFVSRKFKRTVNLQLKINTSGSLHQVQNSPRIRNDSFSALEELLQCGICLERLTHPRMLPCQHTFCLNCLKTHLTAKNLKRTLGSSHQKKLSDNTRSLQLTVDSDIKSMTCPVCQRQVDLDQGFESLEKLPKNLYMESLLKVVVDGAPTSPKIMDYRCVNCQLVSTTQEQVCQHCMQIFCNVCWNGHLGELESNLHLLENQLNESENRLRHKLDNFTARCDRLEENIRSTTIKKVEEILREEKRLIAEVSSVKKEGNIASDILLDSVTKLNKDIEFQSRKNLNNSHKVTTYLQLHRETSKLLEQINFFGEARVTFDPDNYKLEHYAEGIYNDEEDHPEVHATVTNPFESIDCMAKHYKSRSFTPKLLWTKCPRPAGVGIPPWDDTKLYICATDSHDILILDRSKFKLISRINHADMVCPSSIAFSRSRKEIFVSDKWKQCIHVFDSDGEYLRTLCAQKLRSPDGIAFGPNQELIICDTGNDRVLLVDPETGEKLGVIGTHNGVTQLNFPTGVAVCGSDIIVADSGNNRVKTYSINGELLHEFGSFGKNPGQFRSAEVVAVDQLGFILVGDAGNARVQVFKPNGTLVKIFGSKGGFGWVSGIMVSPNLDIITTDSKTKSLRIF